jgi:hypothetical protein
MGTPSTITTLQDLYKGPSEGETMHEDDDDGMMVG